MSSPVFGFPSWRQKRASSLVDPVIAGEDEVQAANLISPPRSMHHVTGAEARQLSSSFTSQGQSHREPIRSFIHGTTREHLAPVDGSQYARSVREDTEELANYALADKKGRASPSFLGRTRSMSSRIGAAPPGSEYDWDDGDGEEGGQDDTIVEVSEPPSPENGIEEAAILSPESSSMLASMLKSSPSRETEAWSARKVRPEANYLEVSRPKSPSIEAEAVSAERATEEASETTPLIRDTPPYLKPTNGKQSSPIDLESQNSIGQKWRHHFLQTVRHTRDRTLEVIRVGTHPKQWDRQALWKNIVVAPVSCLPAVIVGLLLNVLDALSYGE
jgi:sulfate permease, SulP family